MTSAKEGFLLKWTGRDEELVKAAKAFAKDKGRVNFEAWFEGGIDRDRTLGKETELNNLKAKERLVWKYIVEKVEGRELRKNERAAAKQVEPDYKRSVIEERSFAIAKAVESLKRNKIEYWKVPSTSQDTYTGYEKQTHESKEAGTAKSWFVQKIIPKVANWRYEYYNFVKPMHDKEHARWNNLEELRLALWVIIDTVITALNEMDTNNPQEQQWHNPTYTFRQWLYNGITPEGMPEGTPKGMSSSSSSSSSSAAPAAGMEVEVDSVEQKYLKDTYREGGCLRCIRNEPCDICGAKSPLFYLNTKKQTMMCTSGFRKSHGFHTCHTCNTKYFGKNIFQQLRSQGLYRENQGTGQYGVYDTQAYGSNATQCLLNTTTEPYKYEYDYYEAKKYTNGKVDEEDQGKLYHILPGKKSNLKTDDYIVWKTVVTEKFINVGEIVSRDLLQQTLLEESKKNPPGFIPDLKKHGYSNWCNGLKKKPGNPHLAFFYDNNILFFSVDGRLWRIQRLTVKETYKYSVIPVQVPKHYWVPYLDRVPGTEITEELPPITQNEGCGIPPKLLNNVRKAVDGNGIVSPVEVPAVSLTTKCTILPKYQKKMGWEVGDVSWKKSFAYFAQSGKKETAKSPPVKAKTYEDLIKGVTESSDQMENLADFTVKGGPNIDKTFNIVQNKKDKTKTLLWKKKNGKYEEIGTHGVKRQSKTRRRKSTADPGASSKKVSGKGRRRSKAAAAAVVPSAAAHRTSSSSLKLPKSLKLHVIHSSKPIASKKPGPNKHKPNKPKPKPKSNPKPTPNIMWRLFSSIRSFFISVE